MSGSDRATAALDPSIRIRAFRPTEADYGAVARINAAVDEKARHDFEPRSAVDLRSFDEGLAQRGYALGRHVAEVVETGHLVAYVHYFHVPWAHRPERYWCSVRCDPSFARRGIGGQLSAEAKRELDRLGARELWAMVRETRPDLTALLVRHGFRERFRSWDFELDLAKVEGTSAGRVPAEADRRDLVITSLPEEKVRDPDWLPKLHALFVAVNREVPLPGEPDPEPPPEAFAEYLERRPASLPEACFIARDGDRYAGVCILHRSEEDPARLNHLFTGVDSAYRGRGVARALKLETIAFARRSGYARIQTAVESNNPGMLALNKELGFAPSGGLIVFEKQLSSP